MSTMVEKIFSDHTDQEEVEVGEMIQAEVDFVLGNDITAPMAIEKFRETGADQVFDENRIALVPDHFTPNKDIESAEQAKEVREFAEDQNLEHYFEVGEMGIEHCLLPEEGLTLPGEIIIGADSHTCTYGALGSLSTGVGSTDMGAAMATGWTWFKVPETIKFTYEGELNKWTGGKDLILHTIGDIGTNGALYKAMEFKGETISKIPMNERMTISNMAIEAGAKFGLIEPDKKTRKYLKNRAQRDYKIYKSDDRDQDYLKEKKYDVTDLEPQIALPHSPGNTKGVSQVNNIKIDQAVIGSCTNGRLRDLRKAAETLEGHKKSQNVRLIILPCTQTIYQQALSEGLINTFLEAEAVVSTPTCGPCLGGHMGVLAKGEKAIATTNRNFVGRMGHPKSKVYLSNPSVAAASAIKGEIVSPREVK